MKTWEIIKKYIFSGKEDVFQIPDRIFHTEFGIQLKVLSMEIIFQVFFRRSQNF